MFLLWSSAAMAFAAAEVVQVDDLVPISKADDPYVCANMDWWPAIKCDYGWCPWANSSILTQDLKQPRLIKAVRALSEKSPLHLRLGGSTQDLITYQVTGEEKCGEYRINNSTRLGFDLDGPCFPMDRWRGFHELCHEAGCNLVFGVNALQGRKYEGCPASVECHSDKQPCCYNFTGRWDGKNARDLFQYTVKELAEFKPPYAFEFGNELCGYNGIQAQLEPEEYAADFRKLAALVREAWPAPHTPKLVAADSDHDVQWDISFLKAVKGEVDIYTHHMYYLGAGVSPDLESKILDPSYLDVLQRLASSVQFTVNTYAPKTKIWMGETGGAYNSGHENVTDAFMSGFWYLDSMATLARHGHHGFCRQTLVGGNYGLLDRTTLAPNPDFYNALLWTRLMGDAVLNSLHEGFNAGPPMLRAYAHCTKGAQDGRVTLLLLNLNRNESTTVTVDVSSQKQAHSREEYHFTSKSLNSKEMYLNSELLELGEEDAIPELKPKVLKASEDLVMAPLSYAFVVLRGQQAPACLPVEELAV